MKLLLQSICATLICLSFISFISVSALALEQVVGKDKKSEERHKIQSNSTSAIEISKEGKEERQQHKDTNDTSASLQEFNRKVAIAQLILTFLGLGSLLLVGYQIYATLKWNKIDAAFRCMDTQDFSRMEEEAAIAAREYKINITEPLSEDQARTIRSKTDAFLKLKALVYFLDKQAVALMAGYVDEKVVTATWGRLIRGYGRNLSNYIKVTRVDTGDPEVYVELERATEKLEKEYQEHIRKRTGDGISTRI